MNEDVKPVLNNTASYLFNCGGLEIDYNEFKNSARINGDVGMTIIPTHFSLDYYPVTQGQSISMFLETYTLSARSQLVSEVSSCVADELEVWVEVCGNGQQSHDRR